MLLQYFVNDNLPGGWYLTASPIITANLEADSDKTCTVAVGTNRAELDLAVPDQDAAAQMGKL